MTSQLNLNISQENDLQTKVDFCWRNWKKANVLVIFDEVVDDENISNC
ncbi:MAG: hypothetical protein O4861_07675 [Trichodesmium sp. St16_bin4-tuft]|nr:hypothetical protein [Trichodesmium sp. MAG_R01]MDE5067786.1 hypothetical protein [Trichodesmium sp. St4_bin8_1]MDE5074268.1 hypothetical protein [Trichodesmium sp. St5_bin8]MDE5077284.1 hypothetical protein [Trichodesmium sp. St2_bin6]MDE5098218.1 hypothetical protein [Trichodesmium sp. St16_bin4-tuft]MDE5101618.1 hypothetical protein [Trichodesmium sp. St19_bin2]